MTVDLGLRAIAPSLVGGRRQIAADSVAVEVIRAGDTSDRNLRFLTAPATV